jgi:hypothetical protein
MERLILLTIQFFITNCFITFDASTYVFGSLFLEVCLSVLNFIVN